MSSPPDQRRTLFQNRDKGGRKLTASRSKPIKNIKKLCINMFLLYHKSEEALGEKFFKVFLCGWQKIKRFHLTKIGLYHIIKVRKNKGVLEYENHSSSQSS